VEESAMSCRTKRPAVGVAAMVGGRVHKADFGILLMDPSMKAVVRVITGGTSDWANSPRRTRVRDRCANVR
jgi:hypothetical protein